MRKWKTRGNLLLTQVLPLLSPGTTKVPAGHLKEHSKEKGKERERERERERKATLLGEKDHLLAVPSFSEFQRANANYRHRGTAVDKVSERKESLLGADAVNPRVQYCYTFLTQRRTVFIGGIDQNGLELVTISASNFVSVSHVSVAMVMSEGRIRIMPRSTTQFIRGP